MSTNDTYNLLSLLPSTSYTLAYALPLFVTSIFLTFAGCFLTLDRTRTFPPAPHAQVQHQKQSLLSRLQLLSFAGGIGGLCAGYAFGVHFSTFLAIILPNVTSASPLGYKTFLAIWSISAIICLVLAGKLKYVSVFLTGISGYCTLALALSVIVHPPLITRIVLSAVLTTTGTLVCVLPLSHCARIALRVAAASVGAFGLTETVALFSHNPAWGNVWERFCTRDGLTWGTSSEKGLSAAFCFLFVAGLVSDWYLHAKIGENPDEKWDRYLAEYSTELPNDSRRAGTFSPFVPFWDKLLGRHGSFAPIVQQNDMLPSAGLDMKLSPPATSLYPERAARLQPVLDNFPEIPRSRLPAALLRKKDAKRNQRTKHNRRTIKFRPHNVDTSSDSDEDTAGGKVAATTKDNTSITLVESESGSEYYNPECPWDFKPKSAPDYSDNEEDIGDLARLQHAERKSHWLPAFIRHQSKQNSSPLPLPDRTCFSSEAHNDSRSTCPLDPSPSVSVQPSIIPVEMAATAATPSLIKAVERIQLAHNALADSPLLTPTGSSAATLPITPTDRRSSWDMFWNDVKMRAHY